MAATTRLGIIGGNGWLGNAMADAAVASGLIDPSQLTLSRRSDNRGATDIPGAYWTKNNGELAERSDVIVLSVRPDQFQPVRVNARSKLVVSVMAGIPSTMVAEHTNSDLVIRAMPNAAASIRKSFTPWFASGAVSTGNKELARQFFETFGDAAEVHVEAHIDHCVGLTGSGAAFPALLAQAMLEHAVAQGLPLAFARHAVRGVIVNASQLLSGDDPKRIVDEMIAYRGITAAALTTMIDSGFVSAVRAGLEAAMRKTAGMLKG